MEMKYNFAISRKYSKTCLKQTPTGPKKCPLQRGVRFIEVKYKRFIPQGEKMSVRLRQVSALEHVRFRQVSLYCFYTITFENSCKQ